MTDALRPSTLAQSKAFGFEDDRARRLGASVSTPLVPTPLGARAMARCDQLGLPPYSEAAGQLTRRFLTAAHRAALDVVGDWMREAGMSVRLDAAANLIGRVEGAAPNAPALLIGSHIDSVRNGGRYDGALGVMLGIDCVEALAQAGRRLPFAVEVIAFGDEEGSRFPASMICSRSVAGTSDPAVLNMKDAEGIELSEAFEAFGLPNADLAKAARGPGEVLAFLEPHIEQGPRLDAEDLGLGVVTAIAAQKRLLVRLTGTAGHAGTTPMDLRRDPGPGAAEAVLALERLCAAGRDGLVGTVGRMAFQPGAFNVIPGAVEFSMDIRAGTSSARDAAVAAIAAEIEAIAARRVLGFSVDVLQDLPDCPCDPYLTGLLEKAVRNTGVEPLRLPSGAGHDAMVMAGLAPTAMLFIRCKDGVSHNPLEAVRRDDCVLALRAMLAFIDNLERDHRL
jgi:allantoate deiminase